MHYRHIHFKDPHRKKHFEFFRRMDQPHFSLVANVDITELRSCLQAGNLAFTPAIVYLLSRTANALPPFRQRIRGEQVVEHECVHPSYTVPTANSEVFSFCYVSYQPNVPAFLKAAQAAAEKMYHHPRFEDEAGRDDLLFLSAIPWVSFTGLTHAMHYHPVDSVPRISWGKYFTQDSRTLLPLAVQAHHALVDGRHMGQYFNELQLLLDQSAAFFARN
jgi:chloramphenicol O-acetyltransferase type A